MQKVLLQSNAGKKALEHLKETQRSLSQEALKAKNDELTNQIVGEIVEVVKKYGRMNNYDFIFTRNDSMIYQDEMVDLTEQVLRAFNTAK